MPDPSPEILQSADPLIKAFSQYVYTTDESLINGFSRQKIEQAILIYSSDPLASRASWYRAMEKRVEQIDRQEQNRRKTRDKWKDRFIGAAITLLVWAITEYIRRALN